MLFQRVAAGLIAICSLPVFSQSTPLSFKVATVKPADPAASTGRIFPDGTWTGGPGSSDPERIVYTGVPMRRLITLAYEIPFNGGKASDQLSGPTWIDDAKFNIVAKVRPGATKDQVDLMLQNLLAERFGLKVHHETRQVPGYELTQSKGGAKLKPTVDPDAAPPAIGTPASPNRVENGYPVVPSGVSGIRWFVVDNGLMHGTGQIQSISDLILSVILTYLKFDAPLVDQTGLTGKYDYHLDLAMDGGFRRPAGPPLLPDEPVGPDIFPALDKQLGLKLEKKQVSIETLVIDHIERVPADN